MTVPDAHGYAPSGKLTPQEDAWARGLRSRAIDLGWRIVGRDEDGQLVASTLLLCGRREPRVVRRCTITFTPKGLEYRTHREEAPKTKPREGLSHG